MEKSSEEISTVLELVDKEGERHALETVKSDKYLGDVISQDGKNTLNIQERKRRGLVAVSQINDMLNDLCLGKFHFEAGNILRNSLLLSTLLSNSEAWYNITSKEVKELESVDEALLRKIFSAHSKTPLETLYLESGNAPICFLLKARRLNFLWYILNEDEESLIRSFFGAQRENPSERDWIQTIKQDLNDLDISLSMEEISKISKLEFKELVKKAVRELAFKYLLQLRDSHRKAEDLVYENLNLQNYLLAGSRTQMTINERQFLFALRTRMIDVKANFKIGQSDIRCRA